MSGAINDYHRLKDRAIKTPQKVKASMESLIERNQLKKEDIFPETVNELQENVRSLAEKIKKNPVMADEIWEILTKIKIHLNPDDAKKIISNKEKAEEIAKEMEIPFEQAQLKYFIDFQQFSEAQITRPQFNKDPNTVAILFRIEKILSLLEKIDQ
jgi:formyltetrahydrofolate hydrolase